MFEFIPLSLLGIRKIVSEIWYYVNPPSTYLAFAINRHTNACLNRCRYNSPIQFTDKEFCDRVIDRVSWLSNYELKDTYTPRLVEALWTNVSYCAGDSVYLFTMCWLNMFEKIMSYETESISGVLSVNEIDSVNEFVKTTVDDFFEHIMQLTNNSLNPTLPQFNSTRYTLFRCEGCALRGRQKDIKIPMGIQFKTEFGSTHKVYRCGRCRVTVSFTITNGQEWCCDED